MFELAKVIGNGGSQTAITMAAGEEGAIHSFYIKNSTSNKAEVAITSAGVTFTVSVNGFEDKDDKIVINIPESISVTVNAPTGVDVTLSFTKIVLDVLDENQSQNIVSSAGTLVGPEGTENVLNSNDIDSLMAEKLTPDEVKLLTIKDRYKHNLLDDKPIIDLDFVEDRYMIYDGLKNGFKRAPLKDIMSFTRNSPATMIDPFGKIVEVGVDEPRVEKDGILLESVSANLITKSEDFTTGVTRKTNLTQMVRDLYDGYGDAVKHRHLIKPVTTSSVAHYIDKWNIENPTITYANGGTIRSSMIVEYGGSRYVALWHYLASGGSDGIGIRVDLIDGVVHFVSEHPDFVDYSMEKVGTGYRISITTKISDSTRNFVSRLIIMKDETATTSFVGSESDGVYITAWQIEKNVSHPSSYMRTDDTTTKRRGELSKVDITGMIGDKTTIVFEHGGAYSKENGFHMSLYGATMNYFAMPYTSTSLGYLQPIFGGIVGDAGSLTSPQKWVATIEILNSTQVHLKFFRDGVKVYDDVGTGDTSLIREWHTLSVGGRADNTFLKDTGKYYRVKIFNTIFSDDECIEITKPD